MSSPPNDYFYGWDLLYCTIEKKVNKKDDILIALVHFVLTKHSQFRCLGLGDDKTLDDEEIENGSELLPDNWNADELNYALRYTSQKQLYILLGLRTEGSLIITLLDAKSRKVSNIALSADELVVAIKGSIYKMIPTASALVDRFRKELLEPVYSGNKSSTTTQTTSSGATAGSFDRPDPLRAPGPMRPHPGIYHPGIADPRGLPEVGTGDLDPLGRIGGGNLFPFPSHPGFHVGPHGSGGIGGNGQPRPDLQPRFDPFGPPESNLRPNANPDHFQPPNFGGDYYM